MHRGRLRGIGGRRRRRRSFVRALLAGARCHLYEEGGLVERWSPRHRSRPALSPARCAPLTLGTARVAEVPSRARGIPSWVGLCGVVPSLTPRLSSDPASGPIWRRKERASKCRFEVSAVTPRHGPSGLLRLTGESRGLAVVLGLDRLKLAGEEVRVSRVRSDHGALQSVLTLLLGAAADPQYGLKTSRAGRSGSNRRRKATG